MSLSKYYENSSGFQPEELVKGASAQKKDWTPAQAAAQTPFTPLKTPERINTSQRRQEKEAGTPARPTQSPATGNGESARNDVPGGATPAPGPANNAGRTEQHQEIDLSQYIHADEAEQRIATAYQQGFLQGQEKAEQDFGDAAKMLVRAGQHLDTTRETLLSNSAREFQDFALAIAEKIVRTFVREHDQTIIATVEEALQRAVKSEEFSVYVHPDDYEVTLAKAPDLVAEVSGLKNIVIKKDPSVERGGAKLESDNCTIDATIAGQFDIIREHIRNAQ